MHKTKIIVIMYNICNNFYSHCTYSVCYWSRNDAFLEIDGYIKLQMGWGYLTVVGKCATVNEIWHEGCNFIILK
jgi:hypothetical protein